MDWNSYVRNALIKHASPSSPGDDVVEELAQHAAASFEAAVSNGLTHDDAEDRVRALVDSWSAENPRRVRRAPARETPVTSSRGWPGFSQDLRYAYRQLRRSPGFALTAIAVVALGIAISASVFSIINAVLLTGPPYPDPDRLVTLWQSYPGMGSLRGGVSPAEYLDYRDGNTVFVEMAGYQRTDFDLTGSGEPERLHAVRATSTLFDVLQVPVHIGRTFTNAEDRADATRVAVLSFEFWQRRYAGSEKALGSVLTLNEQQYLIIGVMPLGFEFPATNTSVADPPSVWVPMAFTAREIANRAADLGTGVVGRLKPGATLDQAEKDAQRIAGAFQRDLPQFYRPINPLRVAVEFLDAEAVRHARPALLAIAGAVLFVLLVACGNFANLLLARDQIRHREMAVRSAIGASALRIMRQLLIESLLLTLIAGVAGSLLAQALVTSATRWWPDTVIGLRGIRVDADVLLFTLALSVFTGIACGLAPALALWRPDLTGALNQGGRNIGVCRGKQRLRAVLIGLETGCAVVLLIGAGLFARSFIKLTNVPPGFDPNGVVVVRTAFNRQRYPDSVKRRQAQRIILDRLGQLPGIVSMGLTTHIPLADERGIGFTVEGRDPNDFHYASNALVSQDYFAAMGIPLRRGRTFEMTAFGDRPLEIVVNEALAREYWPGEDAIGKRIMWGGRRMTTVGVAGDVRLKALDSAAAPTIYANVFQAESAATLSGVFILRLRSADAAAVLAAARKAIWSVDPGLPVFETRTMTEIVARSLATRRFATVVVAIFAVLALVLAAVGLYAVLSYTVTQRVPEFGLRLALGSSPKRLMRLIIRDAAILVGVALAGGLIAGAVAARLLSSLLFAVTPLDPVTFAAAPCLLGIVALTAVYMPARRASRVDPMVALRSE